MKYSKKQIFEALSYWQKQLKKRLNESEESNQDAILDPEMITQMVKARYPTADVKVEENNDIREEVFDTDVNRTPDVYKGVTITIKLSAVRDKKITPVEQFNNIELNMYETLQLYPADLIAGTTNFSLPNENEIVLDLEYVYAYNVTQLNNNF